MPSRRSFLLGAAAAASLPAAPRTNIVLCMGDDHGWNETGYNGHPFLKTPVLDEMAATGLRFDNLYSAAPVCSPTRGSIMTGRHPNRYGAFMPNWSLRPEETSIAHILGKGGYACGHFGKWHLGPVKKDSPTSPGAMGFHEWLSHDNFFELNPPLARNGGPVERLKGESSEVVVQEALRFMGNARQKNQPFFTVIWFGSPHAPYEALDADLAPYRNAPDAIRARLAEIAALDRAMGRLRQYLQSSGLRDNTLLWYCGDNGTPPEGKLNSPYRGHKGQLYEGGLRVPGIIEWPAGVPKPRRTGVNAVTSDMLPTLCDVAGLAAPRRPLDGISLKPLLDGRMKERPQPICFWQYDTQHEINANPEPYIRPELQEGTTPTATLMAGKYTRSFRNQRHPRIAETDFSGEAAVIGNRYKLVVPVKDARELYDLQADRGETRDLIQQQAGVATQMGRQLRTWQESVLKSLTGADY